MNTDDLEDRLAGAVSIAMSELIDLRYRAGGWYWACFLCEETAEDPRTADKAVDLFGTHLTQTHNCH